MFSKNRWIFLVLAICNCIAVRILRSLNIAPNWSKADTYNLSILWICVKIKIFLHSINLGMNELYYVGVSHFIFVSARPCSRILYGKLTASKRLEEIPILWNLKILCCVQKSSPTDPSLSLLYPNHILRTFHVNVTLLYKHKPRRPNGLFHLKSTFCMHFLAIKTARVLKFTNRRDGIQIYVNGCEYNE
jgi:hypothetical protein